MTSLLLEGGSTLNASALEAGIIDKFCFFFKPR
ncbi:dihydrofolate reductase family protein [Syntrophaceticus schinkii]